MTKYIPMLAFSLLFLGLAACSDTNSIIEEVVEKEDILEEVIPNPNAGINNFIYSGMNVFYRWKSDVPVLSDDNFVSDEEYNEYLQASDTPENFLETLVYRRESVDFFTRLETDYEENLSDLQGTQATNGVEFGLVRYDDNKVLGYVRFILPGSDADGKDIRRGDLFTEVNGTQLTLDNYASLLFSDATTYTLNIASLNGNIITPTGRNIELTKTEYDENPVFNVTVFEEAGKKIGYVHYTQFTAKESELNAAFLELKNLGITDLVLDLRYNRGGYADVSLALASMITGQFKGEILTKQEFNKEFMDYYESECPECIQRRFIDRTTGSFSDEVINSLNLSSVYMIISGNTGSASETLISGLSVYINVKLIGDITSGKYTGGGTIYDSEDFGIEGANPDHTYALYPIWYTNSNSLGDSWPNGIEPDIFLDEDLGNMGILGSRDEPLLSATINDIVGVTAKQQLEKSLFDYDIIGDSRMDRRMPTEVIDSRPEIKVAMKKMMSKKE